MIQPHERKMFESLNLPCMLCRFSDGSLRAEILTNELCRILNIKRDVLLKEFSGDILAQVHPSDVDWLRAAVLKFASEHAMLDVIFRYRIPDKDEYMLLHTVGKWQKMEDGSEMILLGFNDMRRTQSGIGQLYAEFEKTQTELLYTDAITGLPNLAFMRQFAEETIQNLRVCEKTPAVIYVDVKSMLAYNNHYGYEKGDELIKLIGEAIKEAFPNQFVGRGDNDHFIIVTDFSGEETIEEKINGINRRVRRDAFGNTDGICVGVCVIKPDQNASDALDCARQALKDIGTDLNKTCSFYSVVKDDSYWRERYIIENFETALENKWIKVYYQPIVRTETGKITILEALARWIDPIRGMISPGEFIPVLSRYHLLYKLDLYMVEEVCREYGVREEVGLPLIPVSVNFSAQDFDYVDVPNSIEEIMASYGIDPGMIIVEITEKEVAKGTDHFRDQLRQIRADGHRLWIDDFGSEYSSIKVFSQYDVDRIKFDMDLLRHLDDNGGVNRRIMKALVNVCREIGVRTLAEGVETEAQLQFLKEIDCDMAQGFYFFKPDPLEVSVYKFTHRSASIPHETREERRAHYDGWLRK